MSSTTALAIRDEQVTFDEWQTKALTHMGVENATPADLAIFFHQSKRTGLDPFARQIHMIGRNTKNQRTQQWETKFTIQTGIDGYRLIARRAAGREGYGYEDTMWCGPDGQWVDVWVSNQSPMAARVVVVRNGQRFPAVARYKAYVQTKRDGNPNSIWAQRDAEQLEKCAEALALRKAFPQDLSGLYTEDEMLAQETQAAEVHVEPKAAPTASDFLAPAEDIQDAEEVADDAPAADPMTAKTRGHMFALFSELGINEDDQRAGIAHIVGHPIESRGDLTESEAQQVVNRLKVKKAEKDAGADPVEPDLFERGE